MKVDGKLYDEMHVDGGVTRQIYVTPVNLPFRAFDVLYPKPPVRRLYLVHNGKMTPQYGAVTPSTFKIAGESINALMLYQHKGDNYRIYRMAKDAGADFNSVAIPPDFDHAYKEKFDLEYQRALFEEGVRIGKAKQWRKKPIDVPDDPPGRVATPSPKPAPPATPEAPAAAPAQPEAPASEPTAPAPLPKPSRPRHRVPANPSPWTRAPTSKPAPPSSAAPATVAADPHAPCGAPRPLTRVRRRSSNPGCD